MVNPSTATPPSNWVESLSQICHDNKDKIVVGAKIATVALVTIGIVGASIATMGAADAIVLPAIAGGTITNSGLIAAGALYGASLGMGISALFTMFIGSMNHMFENTSHNLADAVNFLKYQILCTGVSAALGALFGGICSSIDAGFVNLFHPSYMIGEASWWPEQGPEFLWHSIVHV